MSEKVEITFAVGKVQKLSANHAPSVFYTV